MIEWFSLLSSFLWTSSIFSMLQNKTESMLNSSLYPYICIHIDMWMAEYEKENEGVWMDGWSNCHCYQLTTDWCSLFLCCLSPIDNCNKNISLRFVLLCFASLLSASHSDGRTFVKSFISLWSILRFVVRGLPFSSALYRNENGIHSCSYIL